METEENAVTENITINFNYFIQLAIRRQLSWKSLAFMLTDLTTTLDRSKQVIRILVQELEKLALKGETDKHKTNQVKVNIQIADDERHFAGPENAAEYFDLSYQNWQLSALQKIYIVTFNLHRIYFIDLLKLILSLLLFK